MSDRISTEETREPVTKIIGYYSLNEKRRLNYITLLHIALRITVRIRTNSTKIRSDVLQNNKKLSSKKFYYNTHETE